MLIPAGVFLYLSNAGLVSVAVALQMRLNPISIWARGTLQNGFAEVAQLGFGIMGAIIYQQSPWGIFVLLLLLVVVYIGLSRLARVRAAADVAMERVQAIQGQPQPTTPAQLHS